MDQLENTIITETERVDLMWFAIDSCGDIETFDSADEAKAAAENNLDMERQEASEGWYEGVTKIMWGKVCGVIKERYRRPRTDEDYDIDAMCDEVVDYDVINVEYDVTDFAALNDAIGCVRDRRTTARIEKD